MDESPQTTLSFPQNQGQYNQSFSESIYQDFVITQKAETDFWKTFCYLHLHLEWESEEFMKT